MPDESRLSLPRRRGLFLVAALAILAAIVGVRMGRLAGDRIHDIVGRTMGTTYDVRVDAELTGDERDELGRAVQGQLDRVEALMSTYDTGSAVSRFNRHASTEPLEVDAAVLAVVTRAREVSERSGGAFDVTVGRLVDAWGFGPGEPPMRIPADATIAELRDRVGYRQLVVDPMAGTLAKTDPRVGIDLSGIAKGYAVEQVAAALLRRGLSSFLVEVGGELKAIGTRRDGRPWRVGIERPDPATQSLFAAIEISDAAIATSGDYRNFFEEGGVRYAHVVDPRTGRPIRSRDVAVTVIDDDAAVADAWATALVVLGPDRGAEVATREGVAALFVTRSEDGFRTRLTPGFEDRAGPLQRLDAGMPGPAR